MKIIKHLINIMFLWSIPYIITAFFLVLTWFSFNYVDAVTSSVYVAFMFFYCLISFIVYGISNEEEGDTLSIIKL